MSSETENEKVFMINDPIHGHIELDLLLVKIIDTPEFQRLRYIKQLGGTYYVYPGGCHNRFEHSIGVCYLAGKMVERLKEKQPELEITPQEVLCVKIAGLCHDLGHGPFSHLFEKLFIPEVFHGTKHEKWEHESASVKMFHHMLVNNPEVQKEFEKKEINSDEQTFIKELMKGEPDKKDPPPERWIKRRFLYEIVANKKYGIDVDRWDYFARDSHSMGIPSNFDMRRTMHLVRVLKCRREKVGHHKCPEGTTHICMRDNEVYNLYEMFHTRYSLHKRAYQHEVVKGVELMITDALVAANDHLTFHGKKMSAAMDDMDAYIQLTDEVFQHILHYTQPDDKLEKARGILHRIQTRKLYKCIIDKSCDDWKKDHVLTGQQIRDKMAAPGTELHDNIHVLVVLLSYGMNPDNPMLFYKKKNINKAVPIPKEEVSLLLPETFQECHIRVYVKKQDQPEFEQAVKDCFQNWWERQPKEKDQGLKEENRKLKEEVKILRHKLEDKEMGSPDESGILCQQESESVQADKP